MRRAATSCSTACARGPSRGAPPAFTTMPPTGTGARMARLRRADCSGPGIRRRRRGKGFEYLSDDGKRISAQSERDRIARLAIPPAWEDVWICPHPNGHIQATGTDAAGRKQYRYHDDWRKRRDREKFEEMQDFARALPRLRRRVERDLQLEGMPRDEDPGGGHPAARPRLLPHRLRGLRRGERHLRGRDHEAAPRDHRGRRDHLRLRGQGWPAPRAGDRGSRGRADRRDT